jgi:hypothetical protein
MFSQRSASLRILKLTDREIESGRLARCINLNESVGALCLASWEHTSNVCMYTAIFYTFPVFRRNALNKNYN